MVDRVMQAVDELWDAEVQFLQGLVRRPSTLHHEAEIQNWIAREMAEMGLEVDRWEIDPGALKSLPGYSPVEWSYHGRPNLVGTLRGSGGGKSLLLNGHVDVVSAEPVHFWSHDPWGGEIVDGRMYGGGSADMKSGIAAMIFAVKALQRAGVRLKGDVFLNTVIEEECTGAGALSTIARGYRADAVVIPEPFGQTALISQVGVLWARVTVRGAGAHARSASAATNAILKAMPLLQAVKELEAEVNRPEVKPAVWQDIPHPINYNIGQFHAGDWTSTVPAEAVFEVRIGTYPGENLEEVKARFRDRIMEAARRDPWLRDHLPDVMFYAFHAEGADFDPNQEIFAALAAAHQEVTGTPIRQEVTTATTDARFFQLYQGVQTTCYGPSGDNLHAADEWVDLESVRSVTKVLARLMMDWCGAEV